MDLLIYAHQSAPFCVLSCGFAQDDFTHIIQGYFKGTVPVK